MTSHVFEHVDQLELFKNRTDGIEACFWEFHTAHPDVYSHLVKLARDLKSRGFKHYGIKALCEVVRYHRAISGADKTGLKINNNYTSRFARLIEHQESDLKGFFEFRELQTESSLKDVA